MSKAGIGGSFITLANMFHVSLKAEGPLGAWDIFTNKFPQLEFIRHVWIVADLFPEFRSTKETSDSRWKHEMLLWEMWFRPMEQEGGKKKYEKDFLANNKIF